MHFVSNDFNHLLPKCVRTQMKKFEEVSFKTCLKWSDRCFMRRGKDFPSSSKLMNKSAIMKNSSSNEKIAPSKECFTVSSNSKFDKRKLDINCKWFKEIPKKHEL